MLMSCIFFLIFIPNLHGLSCYSNGIFYFSREDFHWNNILNHINHPIISNTSTCHVRIIVDYNNKKHHPYVIIKFQPIENISNTNIEFGSTINFHSNNIQTIVSYLDYQCSSGNLCDKNFLKNSSQQYLNASDNSLHKNLLSAWKKSVRCEEKIRTNYCESYLCFTIYNELKNLSYGKFQCHDQSSTNPVNIHIKTNSGNHQQEYQCRKNHCTGEVLYNSLIERNSSEKFRITKNQHSMNEVIFKRAMIISGILLVIGLIAYYIQCRKYKHGYRLTRNT
jgi:hypothetical protein